ncbi:hypothetical protein Tco_0782541 [Tanacetum coccineum]
MGLTIAAAKDVAVRCEEIEVEILHTHINAAFTYDICTVRTRKVTTVREKKVCTVRIIREKANIFGFIAKKLVMEFIWYLLFEIDSHVVFVMIRHGSDNSSSKGCCCEAMMLNIVNTAFTWNIDTVKGFWNICSHIESKEGTVCIFIQLLVHVVIPSHINVAFTYDICTVRTRKVTTVRVKKICTVRIIREKRAYRMEDVHALFQEKGKIVGIYRFDETKEQKNETRRTNSALWGSLED